MTDLAPSEVLPAETAGTQLTLVGGITAIAVVADEKTRKVFFDKVKSDFDSFVPDMTTDAGRKAFASKAFEANKAKAEVERTVKALTEEWRAKTSLANDAKKEIVEELEKLRVNFRKPLTDWEKAEEARAKNTADFLLAMSNAALIGLDETSATIAAKAEELAGKVIDEETFGEAVELCKVERARVLALYNATYERLAQQEEERAEFLRLKAAEDERTLREAQRREDEEAALSSQQEAARREEAERAEREAEEQRVAQAAEEARLTAIREQQEAAQRQLDDQKAESDRQIAAVQEEARIEREARERIEAEQLAEQKRLDEIKRQDELRQQDRDHRNRIMGAVKDALMTAADIDEPTAKKIVLAIASNVIPSTTINF